MNLRGTKAPLGALSLLPIKAAAAVLAAGAAHPMQNTLHTHILQH